MTEAVEFCLLVEAGRLERQAVTLVNSMRRFSGRYSASDVTVVSPRPGRRPAAETIRALERLNVNYLELKLQSPVPDYGPSFRVLALAEVARRAGPPILVQLDSDTLFCAEPQLAMGSGCAAARPVDVKGMCSEGPDDPLESVWKHLERVSGVPLADLPTVETTVSKLRVRASYNAGLFVVKRDSELYQLTAELFLKILNADVRPYRGTGMKVSSGAGIVNENGSEFWGTSQVAFSLAVAKLGGSVKILSPDHNIPLHMDFAAPENPRHLHYHGVFGEPKSARRVFGSEVLKRCDADFRHWLTAQLPL